MSIKIKGIVHCPCRVRTRNIKRFKVMIIVFNFRSFNNLKADTSKYFGNPSQGRGNRV